VYRQLRITGSSIFGGIPHGGNCPLVYPYEDHAFTYGARLELSPGKAFDLTAIFPYNGVSGFVLQQHNQKHLFLPYGSTTCIGRS